MTAHGHSADNSSASIQQYAASIYSVGSSNMVLDLGSSSAQQRQPVPILFPEDGAVLGRRASGAAPGLAYQTVSATSTDALHGSATLQGPTIAASYWPHGLTMAPPAIAPQAWVQYNSVLQSGVLPPGPGPGLADPAFNASILQPVPGLYAQRQPLQVQPQEGAPAPGLQQWLSPKVVDGQVVGYDVVPQPSNPAPVTPQTSMTASLYVKNLPPGTPHLKAHMHYSDLSALLI